MTPKTKKILSWVAVIAGGIVVYVFVRDWVNASQVEAIKQQQLAQAKS
jgi:uncharacterized membrane protein YdjX (TVP38/TMEM64 family)